MRGCAEPGRPCPCDLLTPSRTTTRPRAPKQMAAGPRRTAVRDGDPSYTYEPHGKTTASGAAHQLPGLHRLGERLHGEAALYNYRTRSTAQLGRTRTHRPEHRMGLATRAMGLREEMMRVKRVWQGSLILVASATAGAMSWAAWFINSSSAVHCPKQKHVSRQPEPRLPDRWSLDDLRGPRRQKDVSRRAETSAEQLVSGFHS